MGRVWPARVSALVGFLLLLIPAAGAQLPQASDTTSLPTPGAARGFTAICQPLSTT